MAADKGNELNAVEVTGKGLLNGNGVQCNRGATPHGMHRGGARRAAAKKSARVASDNAKPQRKSGYLLVLIPS
jgi:hypothetical protein